MRPNDALLDLFGRVAACHGDKALVNDEELRQWPVAAVKAMKSQKLIRKARPVSSAICPGCEQECLMPVYSPTGAGANESFIVCDKRSDTNRVMVPVERLTDILGREDIRDVAGLIRQATGLVIASPDPTQVEMALYHGITRFLKGEGRDPLDAALILDYLWRCQLEVMNLSMLLAGKDLEREEVAAELVR